jgi:hypothetical protein
MKVFVGQGLCRHIAFHSVVSVANYRQANSEQPMKGMSEVCLTNGDRLTCDKDADTLWNELWQEEYHRLNP